jgi:hypothetical protein
MEPVPYEICALSTSLEKIGNSQVVPCINRYLQQTGFSNAFTGDGL